MTLTLATLDETFAAAGRLAAALEPTDIVTLSGHLGAGKTTFAAALINALTEGDITVTSPTFNLVQPYDTRLGTVWHLDLYRLERPEAIVDLGIDDMLDDCMLVEWPERAEGLLPKPTIAIQLNLADGARTLEVNARDAVMEALT